MGRTDGKVETGRSERVPVWGEGAVYRDVPSRGGREEEREGGRERERESERERWREIENPRAVCRPVLSGVENTRLS